MLTLEQASDRANEIRSLYANYESATYGREWTTQELMLGFLGDVGDLAKLVQAATGVRNIANADEKLAHEFADCLWSLHVLAKQLNVNIESAFEETMDSIEASLQTSHYRDKNTNKSK